MIEPHVGKVKTDLSIGEFTIIIPLRNKVIAIVKISQKKKKVIAIVKISFCWNILIIKYLIN